MSDTESRIRHERQAGNTNAEKFRKIVSMGKGHEAWQYPISLYLDSRERIDSGLCARATLSGYLAVDGHYRAG